MTLLEAARKALQEMDDHMYRADTHEFYDAKEALRQAIEQVEQQEPVAWIEHIAGGVEYNPYHKAALKLPEGMRFDLYTYPPQRKPLTDEEIDHVPWVHLSNTSFAEQLRCFARAIERAHGIGGGE